MNTINEQLLVKAQKEADERLANLNFPKLRVLPLDRDVHCNQCEDKQGIWYHKCSLCHLTLPTHIAYTIKKQKSPGSTPHQSACRKCMGNRSVTEKKKSKKKTVQSDGSFLHDLTVNEFMSLSARKIEVALLNMRNERDKLDKQIRLLDRLKAMVSSE